MKRVVVAGSRTIIDSIFIARELEGIFREDYFRGEDIIIVSGTAQGVDTIGEEYASLKAYGVERYPADWNNLEAKPCYIKVNNMGRRYNAMAGQNRNKQMAEICDAAIIFWDGKSKGTKNMIDLIRLHNKKLYLFVGNVRLS